MIEPDPDYRPNPFRAIYVHGPIDYALLNRLSPNILRYQYESRDPITVYINSPGGITFYAQALTRLLEATDQDTSRSCRIITVATGSAASAAADLLCAGGYAIAYASANLLFHGVRRSGDEITVAVASNIADTLRESNEQYAINLAEKSVRRLGFRYVWMRGGFAGFRTKISDPSKTDIECFIGLISARLSVNALKVVQRAVLRNQRYEALVAHVSKSTGKSKRIGSKRAAEMEAEIIKRIIDFEKKRNSDPAWNFINGGLKQTVDDFLLVYEYFAIYDADHLKRLCDNWGRFFLDQADIHELDKITDSIDHQKRLDEILKPLLRPLWLFLVALCYELQNEENFLTAEDAFWLGLVDEVIGGSPDLFPFRRILEEKPDISTVGESGSTSTMKPFDVG